VSAHIGGSGLNVTNGLLVTILITIIVVGVIIIVVIREYELASVSGVTLKASRFGEI